jgi:hypothetical protein
MQPIEIALFAVVAVLALALISTVVRPYLRARQVIPERAAETGGGETGGAEKAGRDLAPPVSVSASDPAQSAEQMLCPACQRDYAPGLQFCPHDARQLISANDPAARRASPGATCPICKRSFEAGKRFCAFDGEELVPLTVAIGGVDAALQLAGVLGKICPTCSRRYEGNATFCGRDGEELVAVN